MRTGPAAREERTVTDGAGLGLVEADHFGVFEANLDLFEELRAQDNYLLIDNMKLKGCLVFVRRGSQGHVAGSAATFLIRNAKIHV